MRGNNVRCEFCSEYAETLHHKDEVKENNSKHNLQPLCHKCHLEIKHKCDNPGFYALNKPKQGHREYKLENTPGSEDND